MPISGTSCYQSFELEQNVMQQTKYLLNCPRFFAEVKPEVKASGNKDTIQSRNKNSIVSNLLECVKPCKMYQPRLVLVKVSVRRGLKKMPHS
jgi:hypothetical protein